MPTSSSAPAAFPPAPPTIPTSSGSPAGYPSRPLCSQLREDPPSLRRPSHLLPSGGSRHPSPRRSTTSLQSRSARRRQISLLVVSVPAAESHCCHAEPPAVPCRKPLLCRLLPPRRLRVPPPPSAAAREPSGLLLPPMNLPPVCCRPTAAARVPSSSGLDEPSLLSIVTIAPRPSR